MDGALQSHVPRRKRVEVRQGEQADEESGPGADAFLLEQAGVGRGGLLAAQPLEVQAAVQSVACDGDDIARLGARNLNLPQIAWRQDRKRPRGREGKVAAALELDVAAVTLHQGFLYFEGEGQVDLLIENRRYHGGKNIRRLRDAKPAKMAGEAR